MKSNRVATRCLCSFAFVFAICVSAHSTFGQNVLVNGDFETNPPLTCGNHIGWPISPWVLGIGNQANVVTVDGNVACLYGSNGPQFDARVPSAPAGTKQHYLDIANGSNDFYQSFTPRCAGIVNVGGSFSTRANSSGTGSVTLRQGVGFLGLVVGTQAIILPGGMSQTDPWTPVGFAAFIAAGMTYSFIVSMDNNMNFDEGFVKYTQNCPDPLGYEDTFQINYTANLSLADSVINLKNAGYHKQTLGGHGFLCANVYVFDPAEELISCCSCPLSANSLRSLSVRDDLISNTLTPGVPTSVDVKIVWTTPPGGTEKQDCDASMSPVIDPLIGGGTLALAVPEVGAVKANAYASGGRAWMTHIHVGPNPGLLSMTETRFANVPLSRNEEALLQTFCGFIQANGSGFGICKACRFGGLGAETK